jgi:hypothetical protein
LGVADSGDPSAGPDLQELLVRARAAGPSRIEWRDPMVALGVPALTAVAPWLADQEMCFFAVTVIEYVGRAGNKAIAVRALRHGRSEAPEAVKPHIDAAIGRLGGAPRVMSRPEPPPMPTGTLMMAGYHGSAGVHHIVADHLATVPEPWADLFLTSCGWAFSGDHVRQNGGPAAHRGQQLCEHCLRAIESG